MSSEYFPIAMIVALTGVFFALGISGTLRILVGTYIATLNCLILFLWLDVLAVYLQNNENVYLIERPKLLLWLINDHKILIILFMYFLFMIIFYKSSLFAAQVDWKIKKFLAFLIFAPLTAISMLTSLIIIVHWPAILTTPWYNEFLNSLNILNPIIYNIVVLVPFILVLTPLLVGIMSISIKLPKLRRKKDEWEKTQDKE